MDHHHREVQLHEDSKSFTLNNVYDSHIHFLGTGLFNQRLSLKETRSPGDLKSLKVKKSHFHHHWLLGFGWDEQTWDSPQLPSRKDLDLFFPEYPVLFTRSDAHAVWVNSKALDEVQRGLKKKDKLSKEELELLKALRTSQSAQGVFCEKQKEIICEWVPPLNREQVKEALLEAQNIFNKNGFTHVRDLGCDFTQYEILLELEKKNKLTLAMEVFFCPPHLRDLKSFVKSLKERVSFESQLLKVKGIKVFMDGSLGSEGALISRNYENSQHNGVQLISYLQLEKLMKEVWEEGFDLAVHVIGDLAAEKVIQGALALKEKGVCGALHLEHAQLLSDSQIESLKKLNVTCHMQPCHWLSDRNWIDKKIKSLKEKLFCWEKLRKAQVRLFFGSDSPIEPPSVLRNLQALKESSQEGISMLQGDLKPYFTHRSKDWVPNCSTKFENGKVKEVYFRGKKIYG